MKKQGFTLIELLAAIVILALIALIATPMILNVIEKARKGAVIESVNGLIDAAEKYQLSSMLEQIETPSRIDLTSDILSIKGAKPDKGIVFFDTKKRISIVAQYGKYCIEKTYEGKNPKIVDNSICENIEESTTFVYGVKRAINTELSSWERIESSVGLIANAQAGTTPVQNDFDTIYPWSDIISYNYDTDTKQITAYYGEENFTFTPVGNVEVLTRIPEFYYRRYQDDTYEYIYISKNQREGYTKSEEFSIGRYTMSGDESRVHSRSGVVPLTNRTIMDFRTYARNLGEEFGQLDYHYFILQLLYLVEYADYNSQNRLGIGYTNSSPTSTPTSSGGCDILGMHSGNAGGTDNSPVIYRGIENIFGNVWQILDGINVKDGQIYICYDKNQYESDKFDGCYQQLSYLNASSDGNVLTLGYDEQHSIIAFPTTIGDNYNYISDYYWQNQGNRIVFVGGMFSDGLKCGLWNLSSRHTSTLTSRIVGSRLLKTK